ncbi:ATP-binding protein [Streptomyces sp. NPDC093249]|uniref:ATP-binding protein n=2 Tax=Streptomyces TaxID=1883 RepID=UPI0038091827
MTTVLPPPDLGGIGFEAVMPPERERVAETRRSTAAWLTRWNIPVETDAVVLIVSELVTNAIVHGKGTVRLRVLYKRSTLWIGVTDESTVPPQLKNAGDNDVGGRGLFLVDALAKEWGTTGRMTWAILAGRAGDTR